MQERTEPGTGQLSVSGLYIYPIKSLGGISLTTATLTDRGFKYDRRWMLADESNRFLSQREIPEMALLKCSLDDTHLYITHSITGDTFSLALAGYLPQTVNAVIWDDECRLNLVSPLADEWFSRALGIKCRLLFMADDCRRLVDTAYANDNELTSLSDAYPLLMIGNASLQDLNRRLQDPVPMDRFRPNIVFEGGLPYGEDTMQHFSINDIAFFGVKPCARCPITTTSQQTAERSKEPLKTLATYRMQNNKVYFGQNVLFRGSGNISVGDNIVLR